MFINLPVWAWASLALVAVVLVLHRLRRYLRRKRREQRKQRAQREQRPPEPIVGTENIFNDIYRRNRWGGARGQIYSGPGSEGEPADEYIKAVCAFAEDHNVHTIVDIGCGDFRIGGAIAARVPRYIGVDVSGVVVEHNRLAHQQSNVTFMHLDASTEPLPDGDICLIRQVLQHLPNADIAKIMASVLAKYRFVLVTEHQPAPVQFRAPNHDIEPGVGVRLPFGSAVRLDQPPFGYEIAETLLSVALPPVQTLHAKPEAGNDATFEHITTFVLKGSGGQSGDRPMRRRIRSKG